MHVVEPDGDDVRRLPIDEIKRVAVGGPDDMETILEPGALYTIGFYSETFNQLDGMIIFDGFHTVDPRIDYVGFGVADFTDGLQMPITPDANGLHRWGPNFQFEVIPAPPTVLLLGLGLVMRRRRRAALPRDASQECTAR